MGQLTASHSNVAPAVAPSRRLWRICCFRNEPFRNEQFHMSRTGLLRASVSIEGKPNSPGSPLLSHGKKQDFSAFA